jgi:hypothetical protein
MWSMAVPPVSRCETPATPKPRDLVQFASFLEGVNAAAPAAASTGHSGGTKPRVGALVDITV